MGMPKRWKAYLDELYPQCHTFKPYETHFIVNLKERDPSYVSPKMQRLILQIYNDRIIEGKHYDITVGMEYVALEKNEEHQYRPVINGKEIGEPQSKKIAEMLCLWLEESLPELTVALKGKLKPRQEKDPF